MNERTVFKLLQTLGVVAVCIGTVMAVAESESASAVFLAGVLAYVAGRFALWMKGNA